MLCHLTDRYNDIQSLGIEFLHNIYAKGDLRIRPQTSLTTSDFRRKVLEAMGVDPTKAISQDSLTEPHRIHATPEEREKEGTALFRAITDAVKAQLQGSFRFPEPLIFTAIVVGPVGFEPTTSGPDFSESPAPQVHRPNNGLWYPLGGVMIPGPS